MITLKNARPVILVVDNTPSPLVAANSLLQKLYRVKIALNGEQALLTALSSPPDLILLTVTIPPVDGYELCCWLKKQSVLTHVPVLLITSAKGTPAKQTPVTLTDVDYLEKPFCTYTLLSRIKSMLSQKEHVAKTPAGPKNGCLKMFI